MRFLSRDTRRDGVSHFPRSFPFSSLTLFSWHVDQFRFSWMFLMMRLFRAPIPLGAIPSGISANGGEIDPSTWRTWGGACRGGSATRDVARNVSTRNLSAPIGSAPNRPFPRSDLPPRTTIRLPTIMRYRYRGLGDRKGRPYQWRRDRFRPGTLEPTQPTQSALPPRTTIRFPTILLQSRPWIGRPQGSPLPVVSGPDSPGDARTDTTDSIGSAPNGKRPTCWTLCHACDKMAP